MVTAIESPRKMPEFWRDTEPENHAFLVSWPNIKAARGRVSRFGPRKSTDMSFRGKSSLKQLRDLRNMSAGRR